MAAAPPSRLVTLLRLAKRLAMVGSVLLLVVGLLAGVSGGAAYKYYVLDEPGDHLEREHIRTIIAQESPVYYADEATRIGVFFSDEHREYVSFDELPPSYIAAIVAAEDGGFWSHRGVSPKHIARAMIDNLRAGGLVAGGSTLTQQTAKNLYYRPDRSLRSKGIELLNALRLEAHYSKEEILTFYVNQFHVSGNGRGLGIAARYFFDKEVSDLTLTETAYLAGLVKGPSNYDPFIGDEARRERARARAHARTRYVLGRIVAEDPARLAGPRGASDRATKIDAIKSLQVQAAILLAKDELDLPFKRGTFRYDSNAILDEVARRLEEAPFVDLLAKAGIDDPSTAGLKIITTLDREVQLEATYALWHHLTEAGVMLERLGADAFIRPDGGGPRHDPNRPPQRHEFRLARVTEQVASPKKHLLLDLGGHPCVADRDAMIRAAVAIHSGEKGAKQSATTAIVDRFVDAIPAGSVVLVSVREAGDSARCDLELRPELQGAAVAVQDGRIRAMVGGNDNRNFNRATALRQMGSTWKPLVFHAAMELGWQPTDALDNRRGVFPYSTTFYYPRPDHTPEDVVSMSWAGVNSENLASVWLLYHLTDKLNLAQVRSLAADLDLARREGEGERAYQQRIQELGVLPTRGRVAESLFLQAKVEALSGLALDGHPEDAMALTSLLYGWNFDEERARVLRAGGRDASIKSTILDRNYRDLVAKVEGCRAQHKLLKRALARGVTPSQAEVGDLFVSRAQDRTTLSCGRSLPGYQPAARAFREGMSSGEPTAPTAPTTKPSTKPTPKPPAKPGRRPPTTKPSRPAPDEPMLPAAEDMLIDGVLHVSTLEAVQAGLRRRKLARRAAGSAAPGLYDPEILYWHQDFRVLLALKYVETMARQYGVRTEIQPVLSMPLGASEITLEEATSVYQGLVTGLAWDPVGAGGDGTLAPTVDETPAPTVLIAKIVDVDGYVLYEARPKRRQVATPEVGAMSADILENVVLHGTGRRAKNAVRVEGLSVPIGGKTGTTNEFRNSAFLGFVSVGGSTGFTTDSGYALGVYVGYDDNRPMTNGRIRLQGSSGALPAWRGLAVGLAERERISPPTWRGTEPPTLEYPSSLLEVAVNTTDGLARDETGPEAAVTVLTRKQVPTTSPHLDARPRPVRISPRTEQIKDILLRRREARARAIRDKPSVWDGR